MAKFEEWPLKDAVLKRAMVNGLATFQLQFTWDPCAEHKQHKSLVKRRPSKWSSATRLAYTPEEDDLIVKLKDQGLTWREIYMRYKNAFPQRERRVETLQVRYYTKLKGAWPSGEDGSP